jgi:putative membrane protein
MTIEGVREYEALRDFLYSKMRGTKHPSLPTAGSAAALEAHDGGDLGTVLHEVAAEMRALRHAIESERGGRRDE